MVQFNDVYNGQLIRLDGHYKLAKRIVRYNEGGKGKRTRPFTAILGFCGTDGALLRPPVPVHSECLPTIDAHLRPLLTQAPCP